MSSEVVNRREASLRATRKALIASARKAFGKHGYAGASLSDIARDAGATTGAVYHHFTDKKGLFAAVAEGIEAELVERLSRNAPKTVDLWEIVAYAVTETLEYAARPGVAKVIFKDAPTVLGASAWREIEMKYGFGQLHKLLTALAANGQLAGYDPAIIAGIILGASIQVVDAVVSSDRPKDTLEAGKIAMLGIISAFRERPP
jgi:AcrR family transcriptional regulator